MRKNLYFASLVFLFSCGEKPFYEENKSIKGMIWEASQPVEFDFEIEDSLAAYDVLFNVRITENYKWSNMHVFIEMETPQGKPFIDTFEFLLADRSGKWLGRETGSLVENSMAFINNARFPSKGKYHVKYTQGMTDIKLEEVSDIGLRIRKRKESR